MFLSFANASVRRNLKGVAVTGTLNQFDCYTNGGVGTLPVELTVKINPSVNLYSSSAATAAFTAGNNLHTDFLLRLYNYGTIHGKGGAGGVGGDGYDVPVEAGGDGEQGGTAVYVIRDTYVYNYNIFQAGGGGGGGGGALSWSTKRYGGSGGAGGMGYSAGVGGAGGSKGSNGLGLDGVAGANGTASVGGNGGTSPIDGLGSPGSGGIGGTLGNAAATAVRPNLTGNGACAGNGGGGGGAGGNGGEGTIGDIYVFGASDVYAPSGAQGLRGYALNKQGSARLTWVVFGTRYGITVFV